MTMETNIIITTKEELQKLIRNEIRSEIRMIQNVHQSGDEILNTKEACKLLKVSRNHLASLRQKGIIPSFRLGTSIKYRRIDLMNHINDRFKKRHN